MPRKGALRKSFLAAAFAVIAPTAADAASCTVSATGVAFGIYVPTPATPTDNTGTVTVTCSAVAQPVQYTIALNAGQNSGGSFSNRRMRNATSDTFLSYQLYANSTRTTIWGNDSGGTSTVADSYFCVLCVNQSRNYTAFGRLPGQQFSATPGVHTDTVTVTVTFN